MPLMKKTWILLAVLAATFFLLGARAEAAGRNLSGVWKLNGAKSDYGKFPAPLSVTRKITHNDPKLVLATTQAGPQGDVTSNLTYTTDGKEVVNGDSKGSAQWIGDKLMIESIREFQGATLKQKEIWTLSGDGKTLTVDSHVSIPNGEFDVKQVFEKQ
jgi:hypothetical protein